MFHIPALHVNFFSMWIKWGKRTQDWGWGTIPNFQATCFSIAAHPGQDVLFIITQALTTGTKPFVHNQCILGLMKAFRKERTLNHGFCVRFTRQRVSRNERRGLYSYVWIIHKPGTSADCLDRRGRSDVWLEAKGRHCSGSGSGAGASSLL